MSVFYISNPKTSNKSTPMEPTIENVKPAEHITITAASSQTTVGGKPCIGPSVSWLLSKWGILKALELLFGLIALVCGSIVVVEVIGAMGTWQYLTRSTKDEAYRHFFMLVSISAFTTTAVLFLIFFCKANRYYPNKKFWSLIDLGNSSVWTLFYLVAAIVEVSAGHEFKLYVAAGVFGFLAFIVYAVDTYFASVRTRNIILGRDRTPQPCIESSL